MLAELACSETGHQLGVQITVLAVRTSSNDDCSRQMIRAVVIMASGMK